MNILCIKSTPSPVSNAHTTPSLFQCKTPCRPCSNFPRFGGGKAKKWAEIWEGNSQGEVFSRPFQNVWSPAGAAERKNFFEWSQRWDLQGTESRAYENSIENDKPTNLQTLWSSVRSFRSEFSSVATGNNTRREHWQQLQQGIPDNFLEVNRFVQENDGRFLETDRATVRRFLSGLQASQIYDWGHPESILLPFIVKLFPIWILFLL